MGKYKLTTKKMTTRDGCKWELGRWKTAVGSGNLCSDGVLHFYDSPELAVLLDPLYADTKKPRLYEVEIAGPITYDGLRGGARKMRIIERTPLPKVTKTNYMAFAILCVLGVYREPTYVMWAKGWLDGTDRTKKSATVAEKRAKEIAAWTPGKDREAKIAAWAAKATACPWRWLLAGVVGQIVGAIADQDRLLGFGNIARRAMLVK